MTIQERIEKLKEAKALIDAVMEDINAEEEGENETPLDVYATVADAVFQLNKAIRKMRAYRGSQSGATN